MRVSRAIQPLAPFPELETPISPELHQKKAERIVRSLGKCSPSDYETIIEGAMLAGSHWFNLALHGYGLLPPDQDVMHAEFLTKAERLRVTLVAPELVEALEEIEAARALYVRGSAAGGEDMARRALTLLDRIREIALSAQPLRASS
jgi:hypothetical protein